MSRIEEKLNDFFEVAPVEDSNVIPYEPIQHESLDKDLEKDYEIIRENLLELLDKGKCAMDDILSIAHDSEKYKDFETAAILMKTVVEANQSVIDLHKKVREISNYKQQKEEKTTIKNAVFVGSTAELGKLLKEINEKVI